MKWIERIGVIEGELKKALEEAVTEDQAVATKSLMTSLTAWKFVDKHGGRPSKPVPIKED